MSPLAKIALVVGAFFAVGLTVLVVAGLLFVRKATEMAEDFRENPAETFADMAERFSDDVQVVASDEDAGQVVLRVGDAGELVTVDLSGVAQSFGEGIRAGIDFDGEADDRGGVLRIRTSEGNATIEVRGDEDGGFLRVSADGEEMRFGAGDASAALPRWVPVHPDARVHKRLFSSETDDAVIGGVVLRTDASPEAVIEWYAEELEDSGQSSTVTHTRDDAMRAQLKASTYSDGKGRELSVTVGEDNDGDGFIIIFHRAER
ncbi:MAG: hypothetical protein OXE96_09795 [Gemmatimonadetes bacterium]|nr:hypothetical protein [Gemmatimonadota bacterium]